jgi:ketosteroid isomerase-like protein
VSHSLPPRTDMTPGEIIERLYSAFADRDYDAIRGLCAPKIEWIQNLGFPGGTTYHGTEAIIEGVFKRNDSLWRDFRFELETMHATEKVVTVLGHYTGKNPISDYPFRASVAHIYDVADGRVSRFRMFADTHTLHQSLSNGVQSDGRKMGS